MEASQIERTDRLDRTQYPSDVIALVVLWRLRYKPALRDLPEMFAVRGIVFSYEAVRAWEAQLTPALAEDGGTFNCPHCGAFYEVTLTRQPSRDQDYVHCECCGNTVAEWNSTSVPSFRLIQHPGDGPALGQLNC